MVNVVSFVSFASPTDHDSIFIEGDAQFTSANGVSSGSGTSVDPYIIEDLAISGPGRVAVYLKDTNKHVVIRDLNITNSTGVDVGIQLENTENVVVENITIEGLVMNLYIIHSSMIEVTDIEAIGGKFDIHLTDNLTVNRYDRIAGDTPLIYHGVWINRASDLVFNDSSVEGIGTVGIYMDACSDFTLSNTTVTNVTKMATDLRNGVALDGNTISDVTITACGRGLLVTNTDDLTVQDAFIDVTDDYGINVTSSDRLVLRDNRLISKGMFLESNILDPTSDFKRNTIDGRPIVYILEDKYRVIDGNAAQVFLIDSLGCTLKDLELLAPSFLRRSNHTTISNCSVIDSIIGFSIEECDNSTLSGSSITDCATGVHVKDSNILLIEENRLLRCRFGIFTEAKRHWKHQIERHDYVCNTIELGNWGIKVGGIDHVNIAGNLFDEQKQYGIVLDGPRYVHIHKNRMEDIGVADIYPRAATALNISSNEFERSYNTLYSSRLDGMIFHKNVVNNSFGGLSTHGNANIITWNSIMNTRGYGLYLSGRDHIVHHNMFIGNRWDPYYTTDDQVFDNTGNQTQWDDGKEGNYWGDYEAKYPNATRLGRVWSEPYEIRAKYNFEAFDMFPLVVWDDSPDPSTNCDAGEDITVDEGEEVQFNGSWDGYFDPDILNYTWEFIDGEENVKLYGPRPTYTFLVPGEYQVWLYVEDDYRFRVSDPVNVTVLDAYPPTVDAGRDITAEIFSDVTFDGSGSTDTGTIAHYDWAVYLGDVLFMTLPGVEVEFQCVVLGVFNITLRVVDDAGHEGSDMLVLTVVDIVPPNAEPGSYGELDQFGSVELDASGSHDNVGIEEYTWTIEHDAIVETLFGEKVTYTFEEAGVYSVTLRVVDGVGNEDDESFNIIVKDAEAPSGGLGEDLETGPESSVTLDASDWTDNVNIISYEWTIEDPTGNRVERTGDRITYDVGEPGEYIVTLKVVDAEGNEATDTMVIHVTKPEPTVGDGGLSWETVIIAIAAGVVIVAVASFFVMNRTKD